MWIELMLAFIPAPCMMPTTRCMRALLRKRAALSC